MFCAGLTDQFIPCFDQCFVGRVIDLLTYDVGICCLVAGADFDNNEAKFDVTHGVLLVFVYAVIIA
jgi:hypothetical protein